MARYQQLVFRTAWVITGEAAEAEDAAQEVFVKAYYALPRFRIGQPLRPWLLTIAANEARNRRTAATRRAALTLRVGGEQAGVDSPELAILTQEQRAQLVAALNELRDDERRTIIYRYFLDLSEAEMATLLHCARGTVKSRLSRALGRLRQRLRGGPLEREMTHE